jgi:hypothetical protein
MNIENKKSHRDFCLVVEHLPLKVLALYTGAWGYIEFLDAIQDPQHPEHENFQEWIGENFNSEFYDLQEINQRLADFESLSQQYL